MCPYVLGGMGLYPTFDLNILAESGGAVSLALAFKTVIVHIPSHIARHAPRFSTVLHGSAFYGAPFYIHQNPVSTALSMAVRSRAYPRLLASSTGHPHRVPPAVPAANDKVPATAGMHWDAELYRVASWGEPTGR